MNSTVNVTFSTEMVKNMLKKSVTDIQFQSDKRILALKGPTINSMYFLINKICNPSTRILGVSKKLLLM